MNMEKQIQSDSKDSSGAREQFSGFVRQLGPTLGLIVLCIVAGILSPVFFTVSNLMNIVLQVAVIAVIAAGMTFVILTGGIDLSVGSILGLTGVLLAGIFKATGSVFLAVLSSIVIGGLLGLVNGLLVSYGNVPAFCATLGMMAMARGLAFVYTKGMPISGFPDSFRFFGSAYVGAIPVPVMEAILIFVVAWYILTKTPAGRSIYAVGSNEKASRLSGIKTDFYKMLVYVISGVLTGFAALMFVGRINSAHPLAGQGYELDAIAAVVIGGTSLSGGQGSIAGTFMGALIMGVIRNALNLLNVDAYWQQVVIGAVIIAAVLMDWRSKKQQLA
ncbi:MAG: ribose ABC transporter permease [Firmicutes bacterium]|jgi:ribose transport system permease protein|nr:ribose ABC transporter permease [Bacillota bacterium]